MTPDLSFKFNPKEPVERETARQFAERVSGALLAAPAVLALLAISLIEKVPEAHLMPWLTTTLVMFMVNLSVAHLLLDHLNNSVRRRLLLKIMTVTVLLEGLSWGVLPFMVNATGETSFIIMGILPLCVLAALALQTLCLHPPSLWCFALPALLPVGLYKLLIGSGFDRLVGVATLTVLGLSLVYGASASRRGLKSVRMKVRNDLLVKQLTRSSSDLRTALRKIRQLSTHDPLTQCFNGRALMDHLSREMTRQDRDGQAIGILLVDVDCFKQVNDRHGHIVGDETLKALTERIQSHLRGGDLLARYGGEEFVCVVLADDVDKLAYAGERVRQGVEMTPLLTNPIEVHLTVSIGATLRHPSETVASLLARAEYALRQAKDAGRNRVEIEVFQSLTAKGFEQSVLEFR